MNKLIGILVVTLISLLPYQLAAADTEESSALLCAVIEVFECSLDNDCSDFARRKRRKEGIFN